MKCISTGIELLLNLPLISEYLSVRFSQIALIANLMSSLSAFRLNKDFKSLPLFANRHVYIFPFAEILALVQDEQKGFDIDSINPII